MVEIDGQAIRLPIKVTVHKGEKRMKTFALLASVAIVAASLFTAQAMAGGLSGGLGGTAGLTLSGSGAAGLSSAGQLGSSTASSSWEGYGKGEATFQGSYGQHGTKFKGDVDAASGSLSNAATTANGNGISAASSLGGAFGGGLSVGGAAKLSTHH